MNKICPKNFTKWAISGGTFTFASPNQNVGGTGGPVPPIIAAPGLLLHPAAVLLSPSVLVFAILETFIL